jgi:hypothetical protein
MTEPTPDLAAALARAQGEFENPTKDRTNPHFRNKYATLDSMQTATRPILAKHGLSVVQLPTPAPSLITRLMHSSGQSVQSETPMPASLKPQEYGSALTYMRRYAYAAILNITADEDDDAEAASTAKPSRAAAAKMEPAAPAPGTSSGRDLATDWVQQQRSLYADALTIDAVDAITAKHTANEKAVSSLDRLKRNWPDLWTLLEKARLDAEERVIDAAQAVAAE